MRVSVFILIILGFSSCTKKQSVTKPYNLDIPTGFNQPFYPEDNPLTKAKIALGKKLFFDTQLSKNNNISCASCHKPEFAFSDNIPVSVGTNGELGFRNAPSIINIAYKNEFHMDGGVRTLELQSLAPIIDTNELGGDFTEILAMLNSDQEYLHLFHKAFDTLPTVFGLTRAIASFERSLIGGSSKYDQFLNGDKAAFTESQKRGYELFQSDSLGCSSCHNGILLTNYSYQNIGLEPQFSDSGRARITYLHEDAGKFVVPSLRNVSHTAPYMHNGSMASLDDVILYFENGGGNHWNKSELIHPFTLTSSKREDLIHFLESLSNNNLDY